jgi:hypothetical protein
LTSYRADRIICSNTSLRRGSWRKDFIAAEAIG